jgi:GNAT superfamily N-acetyltransferase
MKMPPHGLTLGEEPLTHLDDYAAVSIAFEVHRVLDVVPIDGGLGGFRFEERAVELPWRKDYDAGEPPAAWADRFDLAHWGSIVARLHGKRVAGAALAFDTPAVRMLEDRRDLAVLWDIRVDPALRGRGIGAALFRAAESWAAVRGCRQLKVETQNVNLPACNFYARQGCRLGAINRFAYPQLPGETQLLWYKELDSSQARSPSELG